MTLALVGVGLEAPEKLEGLGEIYRIVKSLKKTQTWPDLPLSPSGVFLANFVLQKRKKQGYGHQLQDLCQKGKIK